MCSQMRSLAIKILSSYCYLLERMIKVFDRWLWILDTEENRVAASEYPEV
jgi:hypothetical protein